MAVTWDARGTRSARIAGLVLLVGLAGGCAGGAVGGPVDDSAGADVGAGRDVPDGRGRPSDVAAPGFDVADAAWTDVGDAAAATADAAETADVCACSAGPCCNGCGFRSSATPCEVTQEAGCPAGFDCGSAVGRHTVRHFCSGTSSACDGERAGADDWQGVTPCGPTESCVPGQPACVPSPACPCPDGMVHVPASILRMGLPPDPEDDYRPHMGPQHTVSLQAYCIDRYEVTAAEYAGFLNAFWPDEPCEGGCLESVELYDPDGMFAWYPTLQQDPQSWEVDDRCQDKPYALPDASCADHPVTWVTWEGAHRYCLWAGQRLPSEAEWEQAAKGLTDRIHPWGDTDDGPDRDGFWATAPVGAFPTDRSLAGCFDMVGNALEWVADVIHHTYQEAPLNGCPWDEDDPRVRSRVVRGYSAVYRDAGGVQMENQGFRCAWSPEGAGQCDVPGCQPDCAGRTCGADPACGVSCGVCTGGATCDAGRCVPAPCEADCAGRACGPDPVCGRSCGMCAEGESCSEAGQCGWPPHPVGYVRIPAGSFLMGSPDPDPYALLDHETQHVVVLTRPFYLKATEVTQGEWRSLMGYNPSRFASCGHDCPVQEVSWWDAVAYCNALSRAERLPECYSLQGCQAAPGHAAFGCWHVGFAGLDCPGYRLPTDSEWEYAYRAGTTTALYNGDLQDPQHDWHSCEDANLAAIAWFCGNSEGHPHSVGLKEPNVWGLYDMSGNVAEWTWDWYRRITDETLWDPLGPDLGGGHIIRGGDWVSPSGWCDATAVRGGGPWDRYMGQVGLRPARSVMEPSVPRRPLRSRMDPPSPPDSRRCAGSPRPLPPPGAGRVRNGPPAAPTDSLPDPGRGAARSPRYRSDLSVCRARR